MFHFWFTLAMGDDFAPFLASGLGLSFAFFRGRAFLGEKVCADVQIVAVYDHEEGVQAFPPSPKEINQRSIFAEVA